MLPQTLSHAVSPADQDFLGLFFTGSTCKIVPVIGKCLEKIITLQTLETLNVQINKRISNIYINISPTKAKFDRLVVWLLMYNFA